MNPADHISPDHNIDDAAANWLARRDGGFSAAEAAEFARWRDSDTRHAAAVRRAELTQNLLARLPETPAAAAMLAEVDALCATQPKVIPFSAIWKTAAGLAAAACLAFYLYPGRPAGDDAHATYTTSAGHHQSVTLPDGSTLVLNGNSRVSVAYEPNERRMQLEHGEAHFYVAKDASRPFFVSAGTVTVRAVGTAFNVRRQVAAVEVLVTEGKVKVSRQDTSSGNDLEPVYLAAGERAFIDTVPVTGVAQQLAQSPGTAELTVAQRAPRLMFNNTPLSEVIDRFNHYSRIQLEIADAELASRGVGGNFDADNAESFINLLIAAGDIRVERVSEGRVRLHKAL